MKLTGKHINTFRRKDTGPSEMKTENMRVSSKKNDDGSFVIQIADASNPEFYINLTMNGEELLDSKNVTPQT